ncbi:MAG: hypothetical protein CME68_08555 [Halobacteriovoraceae bacterium]|nr:hypothetical protein [Halobacteriovoraceae bacterium]
MIYPVYEGPEIEVLHEDAKCIILNKSSGIHSHPLKYNEKDNCLSFLRNNNYFEALKVNKNNMDRGLLYRLDYGTSGVLVLVKDEKDYLNIREDFNNLVKEKCYLTIVEGHFESDGEYTSFLRPSLKHGKKMVVSDHREKKFLKETREGKILIKKVHYNSEKKVSLLMIKLKTGLRHQIRAQLSHLGFPILGDELYGGGPSLRIFLHALYYEVPLEGMTIKGKAMNAYLFEKFFNLDSFFEVIKD